MNDKTSVPEPVIVEDWSEKAEMANFDVADLASCFHYLAENSYGVTCSRMDWSPKWPLEIFRDVRKFHGPAAARTISTLVELHGVYGYAISTDNLGSTSIDLLKLATYQSELHRGVRNDSGAIVS